MAGCWACCEGEEEEGEDDRSTGPMVSRDEVNLVSSYVLFVFIIAK